MASARHSMGVSRINGTLLDLKPHSAATTLQVSEPDGNFFFLHFLFIKIISIDKLAIFPKA